MRDRIPADVAESWNLTEDLLAGGGGGGAGAPVITPEVIDQGPVDEEEAQQLSPATSLDDPREAEDPDRDHPPTLD